MATRWKCPSAPTTPISNYYGIQNSDARYELIAENNLFSLLSRAFSGQEITVHTNLSACAEEYLRSLGLGEEEITQLRERLSERI